MKPERARALRERLHAALDAVLDAALEVAADVATPADDLVLLAREPLETLGLEHRPVIRAAESGALRTVRLGRRRYTRRSWVAAWAATLPPAIDASDELRAAAVKSARRRAAR